MTNERLSQQADKDLIFVTKRPPIVMEKGTGVYLWDVDGNRYLDFIGGWAVTNLGHCPPVVERVLTEQGSKLINASPSFLNREQVEFAHELVGATCMDRVWFGNSGAEVNEAAVKLARKWGSLNKNGAYQVITTKNSFHGRTLAMMAATGKDLWKDLYKPRVEGFIHVPFNDIEAVRAAVTPETIAVMIEPVQGEGGVYPASEEYVRALRKLCDDENLLLIFDEIQTGFGRTGTLFCYEQYGIEPDIITLAKGIGAGFPLSAILTKDRFNCFAPGDQGGTFGGQPLSMAVGRAVLREMIETKTASHARLMGEYLMGKLAVLAQQFDLSNIRGRGLLIGVDTPKPIAGQIVSEALSLGLIINAPRDSILRFMPPLIVSKEEIDEMIAILERAMVKAGL